MHPVRLLRAACFLLLALLAPLLFAADSATRAFDLPADTADRSLKRLATQSGVEVLFPADATAAIRTHAVRGTFTPLEAARQLLAGTPLTVAQNPQTSALIVSTHSATFTVPLSPHPPLATPPSPLAASGSARGRIFNPATGEYVRNAEISLRPARTPAAAPAPFTTLSADDGTYDFPRVPAGDATLTVTYTGYAPITTTLTLAPNQTTTRDIELISTDTTAAARGRPNDPIKLQAFTVSSEREGNAKAIMDQRNSMNITNTVASDVFGDMAEGNIGDFLRNIPGLDLELTQGEVRNVRLRGLGSEYNSVTMDGVSLASADANQGAAGNARAFSFEQVSLSSVDSIEVSKTISADVDANAPAGTINLKTKKAFTRAGRRITAQINLTAFADEWHFRKTFGPDDERHYKINPGGILEYSDIFFNRRLGVVLSIAESNLYSENARGIVTYNTTPTAADPRPIVPTSVALLHAPRLNRRSTVNLNTDFKATEHLVLSLGLLYNYAALYNHQRTMTFGTGTRANVTSPTGDPLTSLVSAANGTVTSAPNVVVKPGETYTVVPKFEYKRGALLIEGRFAGSDSKSWYNPLARKGSINTAGSPALASVQFRAERSSLTSADWRITQLGGSDWSSGAGYSNPVLQLNDGRFGRTQVYSGDIALTYRTQRLLPVTWKTGVKRKHEERDFLDDRESKRYAYTGPGAGVGAWAGVPSPYRFDPDSLHAVVSSTSGGSVFIPNTLAIGRLYQERPDYFTQSLTAANYYNAFVGNVRHYEEEITAGFLMATTSVKRAVLRAGIRFEDTGTDALEFDPRSPAELRAAGFAETNGRATTIPGIEYQFLSQPKIHREGGYHNWFPSASIKYKFSPNLDAHLGFSSTIRRPTIRDLAGVWVIDDDNLTVNAPNPRLKPETSKNLAARLAYYFEPVGILAFNLFQNTVRGLHRTTQMTAEEYGYDGDLDLSAYRFTSVLASQEEVQIRGMELEYSQTLSFLPRPLKSLTARASYTRSYSSVVTPLMSPHGASLGLNYTFRRLNVYGSLNWRDDTPTNTANTQYNRHRAQLDVGGSFRLSSRFSLLFTGRNIDSEPVITMQRLPGDIAAAQTHERTGTIWTFGLKGVW